jgi:hypothetical protein
MKAFLTSHTQKATYGGNPVFEAFRQRVYLRSHDDLYGHDIMEACSAVTSALHPFMILEHAHTSYFIMPLRL